MQRQSRQAARAAARAAAKTACRHPRCVRSLIVEYLNGMPCDLRVNNVLPVGFLPTGSHKHGPGCEEMSGPTIKTYPILSAAEVDELRQSDRVFNFGGACGDDEGEWEEEEEDGGEEGGVSVPLSTFIVQGLMRGGQLPRYDAAAAASRSAAAGRLAEAEDEGEGRVEEGQGQRQEEAGVAETEQQETAEGGQQEEQEQDQERRRAPRQCYHCGMTRREAAAAGRKLRLCAACLSARFCSERCQRQGWEQHRAECRRVAAERRAAGEAQGAAAVGAADVS